MFILAMNSNALEEVTLKNAEKTNINIEKNPKVIKGSLMVNESKIVDELIKLQKEKEGKRRAQEIRKRYIASKKRQYKKKGIAGVIQSMALALHEILEALQRKGIYIKWESSKHLSTR